MLNAGVAVDEEMIGRESKLVDSQLHGEQGCGADVDAVDGGYVYGGDGETTSAGTDLEVERFALALGELLGVVEIGERAIEWENDGCSNDGTTEWTAAGFVNTGNAKSSFGGGLALEVPGAGEFFFRLPMHFTSIGSEV